MKAKASTLDKRRPRSGGGETGLDGTPKDQDGTKDKSGTTPNPCEVGFRFDPYWDEVFAAYYDPTMGTCCRR